jgi:hypothetical protein
MSYYTYPPRYPLSPYLNYNPYYDVRVPMHVYIWTFFKNNSLPWCLYTGEQALWRNGFKILDPAANGNGHVIGIRSNPEVIATVVCTRLGHNPTSVVVHALSSNENAARTAAAHIRDYIKNTVSLEGDVVHNPVHRLRN